MCVQVRLLCTKSNAPRIRRARCWNKCRKFFMHSMSGRMFELWWKRWMHKRFTWYHFERSFVTFYNRHNTWFVHVLLFDFGNYCVPAAKMQGILSVLNQYAPNLFNNCSISFQTISSGMWTVLEIILLGILLMYASVGWSVHHLTVIKL